MLKIENTYNAQPLQAKKHLLACLSNPLQASNALWSTVILQIKMKSNATCTYLFLQTACMAYNEMQYIDNIKNQ